LALDSLGRRVQALQRLKLARVVLAAASMHQFAF
jgi:hypothetical protein